jgi:hypothetical protein
MAGLRYAASGTRRLIERFARRSEPFVISNGRLDRPFVTSEVRSLDFKPVTTVLEERGALGVGQEEAVETGFPLSVLPGAGRIDPSEVFAAAAVFRDRSACGNPARCGRGARH